MDIDEFMLSYKRAWETSDEHLLASLFAPDGVYRNTPFAEQRGHEAIRAYWQRTKLQDDIRLEYEVLERHERGGIAHWHTTYQVTSEELFRIWAASTGTNLIARHTPIVMPRAHDCITLYLGSRERYQAQFERHPEWRDVLSV